MHSLSATAEAKLKFVTQLQVSFKDTKIISAEKAVSKG